MGSGVGYSKLYLFHIVLVIFFFSFLYVYAKNGKQETLFSPRNKYIYFLYFFFSWYTLSIIWSLNPLYTLQYLFYLTIGISIVFLINSYANTIYKYSQIFVILKLFFLIAILIGILEAFTPFRLPTSPFSEYASLFGRKGTDFVDFNIDIIATIRSAPTVFWGNPNNLAVSMIITLPFFLLQDKFSIKLIGLSSIFLIVSMAGSRGSLISFAFLLFLYLFMKGIRYWLPIIVIFLTSLMFIPNYIEGLKDSDNARIAEMAGTGDALFKYLSKQENSLNSISARQQLIKNGLDALWDSKGLGVGGGASIAVQEQKGEVGGRLKSMHNFWIEILVDAGIVVFILFMTWYLSISIKLYLIHKRSKDIFFRYNSGALFLSMMSFLISAISASSVIYLLPMWLMFGMSIALISLHRKENIK
ncbi:O-antigen ligase family protein [Cocleimonas sp. KMM 6895]|nr:O-antigen ligase family protein [Cocleimonas sp. KMM 6892]MEC4714289.1 O-antigen ligase family protein [Cocleimonas sp. KMM 6895]MEC4743620.1 O-antigen ligase family protein [Cocleimonas sp. KMM 6896]